MAKKKIVTAITFSLLMLTFTQNAGAFDVTGGMTWQDRTGPGFGAALGINGCTRDWCDDWDTTASIGTVLEFFWRVIPNVVIFFDLHIGHIPADADAFFVDDDDVMALQLTTGAEFHLPVAAWVAPYIGLGFGYAFWGVWGESDVMGLMSEDFYLGLHGVDFQLRFGADFYPFSSMHNLAIGPALYVGMPYWVEMCIDIDKGIDECDEPDDMMGYDTDQEDLPIIVFFGGMLRYGF